jgi:cobalt-zinc-cadmium resistance protein CzcA
MLNAIVEAALRYKVLVLVGFAVVIGLGIAAYRNVPVDAFPDVTPSQVNIYTESPGVAAEDIERLLTVPIEAAMAGLAKVEVVRSVSLFGLSYVAVYFTDDTDIYFARRLVGEKLQEVKGRLPKGYGEPELGPNSSGLGQVYWYTIEDASKKLSAMELRTLHDWTVRLIVRTAPGVDDVTTWGGFEKQLQVQVDPQRLIKYGVSLKNVMEALTANNKQVGGQYLNIGVEQYLVRGLGLISSMAEIEQIVVAERAGRPIYIKDVADVKEAPAVRFGAVTRNGQETVLGLALSRINENAATVVAATKAKLAIAQAALPKGVELKAVYDRTTIVAKAVATSESALLEGSILVAVILFLFLGEFRSALVVLVTLPLGMLIAFILMERFGVSANLMSLGGLAIGIGMMVDGAVVMVENAFRLLSHARESGRPFKRTHVVLEAAREVANPIAFAILIIIVVFLPLFSLTGLEGKLFKPMALTITFAMVGSLVLSLTLVPVLAALILKPKEEKDTWLLRGAKKLYLPLLDWALERKKVVMIAAVALLLASISLFPFLGKEFMPPLTEGTVMFRVSAVPSTSLEESVRIANVMDAKLRAKYSQVNSVLAMIGRAEKGETTDVSYMELLLDLKAVDAWPKKMSYAELAKDMQEMLEVEVPTAVFAATQPIQSRVEELISGVRATLALKIYGADLDALESLSSQIKTVIGAVPGVADLSAEANKGKPQIVIKVDRAAAARYGLNADDILQVVQAGIGGETVSTLIDGTKRFDISVRLPEQYRSSPAAIAAIPVRTSEGALIPFSQVAKIELDEGYTFVRREALQRYAVLQMDVQGRDVDSFVKDANAAIAAKVKIPTGNWVGVRKPAACDGAAGSHRAADDRADLHPAVHRLQFRPARHADHRQCAVRDHWRNHRPVRHRAIPVGAVRHRFHRGLRGGNAQRDRAGDIPQRPAAARTFDPRRGPAGSRLATASGPDDGIGRDPGAGPDVDLDRRRRGNAAAARHRCGGRADHVDAVDAAAAATDV